QKVSVGCRPGKNFSRPPATAHNDPRLRGRWRANTKRASPPWRRGPPDERAAPMNWPAPCAPAPALALAVLLQQLREVLLRQRPVLMDDGLVPVAGVELLEGGLVGLIDQAAHQLVGFDELLDGRAPVARVVAGVLVQVDEDLLVPVVGVDLVEGHARA